MHIGITFTNLVEQSFEGGGDMLFYFNVVHR